MSLISRLRCLRRNLLQRGRVERELDDEVRGMFDLLVDEKIAAGMSRPEAQRAATLELGGVESIKTHVRQARAGALWDTFLQDSWYGVRLLWRHPLFTATATLSLAICIGANTTVFSIANRLLFCEPAGVAESDRLVDIAPTRADGRFSEPVLSYAKYVEIRERVTTLEGLYGYQLDIQPMSLGGRNGAERVFSTNVTSNYFDVLGVTPAVGRLFGPQDSEELGGSDAVVLGHRFWTRRFNADPSVIGQTLQFNGQPLTIVGVTPEAFQGLSVVIADVWMPTSVAARLADTGLRVAVGGRLKTGISIRQAAAEVDSIGRALQDDAPPPPPLEGVLEDGGSGSLRLLSASPIPPIVRVAISAFLVLLMGIVALVLCIACANLTGILLARGTMRQREVAVRLAIGAGRARLIRQLLTETLLLFAVGGAAGLVLARVMTSLIVLALPPLPVPVDTSLSLDHRVIAFTAMVSLVAAVLSGLVPALRASRADVVSMLQAHSPGASDRLRLRSVFVIAQIAFSMVLLVCSGLLARALDRSGSVDFGFDPQDVEVAAIDLSLAGYTSASGPIFVRELLDRLRRIPGVGSATAATVQPLAGQTVMCCGVSVPGVTPPNGQSRFYPFWYVVEPGYFSTLRVPLVAGRDFVAADRHGREPIAIVSATAARQFWPDQNAIGQHIIWHQTSPYLDLYGSAGGEESAARRSIPRGPVHARLSPRFDWRWLVWQRTSSPVLEGRDRSYMCPFSSDTNRSSRFSRGAVMVSGSRARFMMSWRRPIPICRFSPRRGSWTRARRC